MSGAARYLGSPHGKAAQLQIHRINTAYPVPHGRSRQKKSLRKFVARNRAFGAHADGTEVVHAARWTLRKRTANEGRNFGGVNLHPLADIGFQRPLILGCFNLAQVIDTQAYMRTNPRTADGRKSHNGHEADDQRHDHSLYERKPGCTTSRHRPPHPPDGSGTLRAQSSDNEQYILVRHFVNSGQMLSAFTSLLPAVSGTRSPS